MAYAATSVSGYPVAPAELEVLLATHPAVADAIPRTPSGKLLRRALADQDRLTVHTLHD